jgi:hypothetical protein
LLVQTGRHGILLRKYLLTGVCRRVGLRGGRALCIRFLRVLCVLFLRRHPLLLEAVAEPRRTDGAL